MNEEKKEVLIKNSKKGSQDETVFFFPPFYLFQPGGRVFLHRPDWRKQRAAQQSTAVTDGQRRAHPPLLYNSK
jgi:hypothetical protein